LLNPLSAKLLAGEFKEGERVKIDAPKKGGEELEFKKAYVN